MFTHGVNNTTSVAEGQLLSEKRKMEALTQLLPIGVLIILTNSVVFVLFCSRPSLRKAPNYLLFSLAICDFLNGSLNISLFITVFIPVVKGETFVALICALEVSHNFVAITAASHIFLITAEKYLAVMRPLKYHVIKKRTMLLVIAGAWLTSALVAAAPIGWFSMRYRKIPIGLVLESAFNIFCLFAVFVAPYSFIVLAHVAMFRKVWKRNRHRNRSNQYNRTSSRKCKKRNERKCVIIFATMATIFAVCWLPWFALRLVYSLVKQRLIKPDYVAMEIAAHVILIVRYLTSAINPLLYTFFKQDFWRALKRTVLKLSRKEIKHSSSAESRLKKRLTRKVHHHQLNSAETSKEQNRKHLRNCVTLV